MSWDKKAATFNWGRGEVKLPVGFTYNRDRSTDTFEGRFTSPDGRMIVRHDIGGYAGAWAKREWAFLFEERVVESARVWISQQKWPDGKGGSTTRVAVTFPDSGCANFFLESSRAEDAATIDFIARTFRPKGRIAISPLCR